MCGRFGLAVNWDELLEGYYNLRASDVIRGMPPRYNIAPTQPILTIGSGFDGHRAAMLVRWGLMPRWVKDPAKFTLLTNARSETAIEKPSFKSAMRHRRVLIPASGFYEWQRFGKGQPSQPYWVRPKKGGIVAFGGLMETWSDPNGSEIDTGCIMTTDASDSFRAIHHRLPLVIHPKDFSRWLDCKTQEPREILDLLQPVDDQYFEAIPVGDAVNKVANTDVTIQNKVEPVSPAIQKPNNDNQLSMF